jgi:PmbA protein
MIESGLLPHKRCHELFQAAHQAAKRAGIDDVEVSVSASQEALTRFANNEIHQNVSELARVISVRLQSEGRTARVTTNKLHRDGIHAAVDEAVSLTRASERDPDLLPLYEDNDVLPVLDGRYCERVANCTPAERAQGVAQAIDVVERHANQVAAGIYATGESAEALLNSSGVFRYHAETLSQFSVTAMAGNSSGWAKATAADLDGVKPAALARIAADKARHSADPTELPPGEYTVVLEPAAVLDLVGQIFGDFSATALRDQRSFLNGRLGERIFGPNINIYDSVECPLQTGVPFDGEGVARRGLTLVDKGIPRDIAYSRAAAAKAGMQPTGHGYPIPNEFGESPVNIVMAGGDGTLDDLISGTKDGILVTRLWYIREVEPYSKLMTGMTRDGTFLIQDGEIVRGLRNFRFNQSVVDLLNNVEAMSRSVRASGEEAFDMVVPGMRVHGFRFSEVTTF